MRSGYLFNSFCRSSGKTVLYVTLSFLYWACRKEKVNNPTSVFVFNTFLAILYLSNRVKVEIPVVDYYFGVSVPSPLNTISEILQNRQLAYRLMVIETALNIPLPFPDGDIKGEDVENIAFCYHAIVNREFDWLSIPRSIPWEASQENLSYLPETSEPTPINFGSEFVVKTIFGVKVPLGIR